MPTDDEEDIRLLIEALSSLRALPMVKNLKAK